MLVQSLGWSHYLALPPTTISTHVLTYQAMKPSKPSFCCSRILSEAWGKLKMCFASEACVAPWPVSQLLLAQDPH